MPSDRITLLQRLESCGGPEYFGDGWPVAKELIARTSESRSKGQLLWENGKNEEAKKPSEQALCGLRDIGVLVEQHQASAGTFWRETFPPFVEMEIREAERILANIAYGQERDAESTEISKWFKMTKEKTLAFIPAEGIREAELHRLVEEAFSQHEDFSQVSSSRIREYVMEFERLGLVKRSKQGRSWISYLIDHDRAANVDFGAERKVPKIEDIGKWFETVERKTLELITPGGIYESDLAKQVRALMGDNPPSAYRITEYINEFEKAGKVRRLREGRRQKVFLVVASEPNG